MFRIPIIEGDPVRIHRSYRLLKRRTCHVGDWRSDWHRPREQRYDMELTRGQY